MNKTSVKSMTSGNPLRIILIFSLPVLFSNLFQQIYSIADTAIVSKTLGEKALAAVGSIGSVNFLILGFCSGIGMGFAIPIAQCFGAGDIEKMKKYAGNALWVYAVISLIFTAGSALLTMPILRVTNTPEDIIGMAYRYLFVIFLGIPAMFGYNTLSGIIRSVGDSKTPLYILIAASIVNIILDLVFILVFHLGTMGAALATILSQFFSCLGCLLVIRFRIPELHLNRSHLVPDPETIRELLKYGLPTGLQVSVAGIGSIILQTSVNTLGSTAVAAVVAAERIGNTLAIATTSIASAMSVFCGQNLGAKKYDRIDKGVRTGVLLGFAFSALSILLMLVFGRNLLLLFLDADAAELNLLAYRYMIIAGSFLWAQSLIFSVRFSIQGLGRTDITLAACLLEMVARGLFGLFVVPAFGFTGACFSSPAAWILADLLLVPAYLRIIRKLKAQGAAASDVRTAASDVRTAASGVRTAASDVRTAASGIRRAAAQPEQDGTLQDIIDEHMNTK